MRLSVITVVRNAQTTIEKTILSVVNQTYSEFEYIVIDGLSDDGTLPIIHKHLDRIDKFISEPDSGIYDAMNKGISIAKGEWVYFLGADDTLYTPHTLHEVFSDYDECADVLYGNVLFKNSNVVFDGKFDENKMCLKVPCHQAIFYKTGLFNQFGLFDIRYKINADAVMHIRTYTSDQVLWSYIDLVIAVFDDTGVSSVKKDVQFRKDSFELLYNNFLGKCDPIILARVCLANLVNFAIRNNPKVTWSYLSSIQRNIGISTFIKVSFLRFQEVIVGDK